MKFSYVMLPDYPLLDSIETIKLADELGFYGCYSVDETWHKDMWLLFAAAADKTESIRFGPSLTPIGLREPTLVCQALATLDELTGGRTECVFSIGNFGLLSQYGIEWAKTKPLSRVKEAHHVMRTFLDEGAINFEGEFYRYSGLFTFARPVQEHLPLLIGGMRGPKSFQVAGEISDGTHTALNYSREAFEYVVENFKIGADRAGRDWRSLDIGAWCVAVVGPDSAAAKETARAIVALYISSMPREQLERHGIDPDSLTPIVDALAGGDVAGAGRAALHCRGACRGGREDQARHRAHGRQPHGPRPHRPAARQGLHRSRGSRTRCAWPTPARPRRGDAVLRVTPAATRGARRGRRRARESPSQPCDRSVA
jgi:alkanesulfonate monooxygenase SsuD/methylene tetrahydromethanopterin reductase-like flavin-dependent oxidoreductase (luciferase family)